MSEYYTSSKWMNSPEQEKLFNLFFKNSPIIIDLNYHGIQTVRGNKLVFSAWAGPLQCITHIIHEMGHLIEIDDERVLKNNWGLVTPEVYIPGRYSRIASVPQTYQPSLRECRAIACQYHIQKMLGIDSSSSELVSALKWMPDWCNIPHSQDYEDEDFSLSKVDQDRLNLLEQKMLEYANYKYTLDFVLNEWKRKNNLLRNQHV
jgi:hypothetical protein